VFNVVGALLESVHVKAPQDNTCAELAVFEERITADFNVWPFVLDVIEFGGHLTFGDKGHHHNGFHGLTPMDFMVNGRIQHGLHNTWHASEDIHIFDGKGWGATDVIGDQPSTLGHFSHAHP